jgi:hypothetical protein
VYYVGTCRVCWQGLLGVRICCDDRIGLVLCEECEAIWLEPACTGAPLFPSPPDSRCPRCGRPLWEPPSHWASHDELDRLDWTCFVLGEWDDGRGEAD